MSDTAQNETVHREIDPDAENPASQIAEMVAELEDKDHTEMATMYEVTDHVIDHIFSTPPAPEAQFEVSFNYEGYRITLEQNGSLRLRKTHSE